MPVWLIEVLDRELPELRGAARDRLATLIVEAIDVTTVSRAIKEAAERQLRANGIADPHVGEIALDISGNASMAVIGALGGDL
jgi:hypothetical protein